MRKAQSPRLIRQMEVTTVIVCRNFRLFIDLRRGPWTQLFPGVPAWRRAGGKKCNGPPVPIKSVRCGRISGQPTLPNGREATIIIAR